MDLSYMLLETTPEIWNLITSISFYERFSLNLISGFFWRGYDGLFQAPDFSKSYLVPYSGLPSLLPSVECLFLSPSAQSRPAPFIATAPPWIPSSCLLFPLVEETPPLLTQYLWRGSGAAPLSLGGAPCWHPENEWESRLFVLSSSQAFWGAWSSLHWWWYLYWGTGFLCCLLTASVSPRAFDSNLVSLSQHVTTSALSEAAADLLRMNCFRRQREGSQAWKMLAKEK